MIQDARSSLTRYALVVGSSSGIGKAMASRLARAGYNLILVSERDMELTLTQAELATEYPAISIDTFSADLSVAGSSMRLYEAISRRRPRIDVLVTESWTGDSDLFGARTLAAQLRAIRVNVEALTVLTQRVAGDMVANGGGRILTITVIQGDDPVQMAPIYPATSAFIEQYSRDLNQQLDGTSVTVTCVRAALDNLDEVAELAFDGMIRGDEIVALDGVHKTPITPLRTIPALPARPRAVAALD